MHFIQSRSWIGNSANNIEKWFTELRPPKTVNTTLGVQKSRREINTELSNSGETASLKTFFTTLFFRIFCVKYWANKSGRSLSPLHALSSSYRVLGGSEGRAGSLLEILFGVITVEEPAESLLEPPTPTATLAVLVFDALGGGGGGVAVGTIGGTAALLSPLAPAPGPDGLSAALMRLVVLSAIISPPPPPTPPLLGPPDTVDSAFTVDPIVGMLFNTSGVGGFFFSFSLVSTAILVRSDRAMALEGSNESRRSRSLRARGRLLPPR
jgi:hypothetical protein